MIVRQPASTARLAGAEETIVGTIRINRLAFHLILGALTDLCLLFIGALLVAPFGLRGSGAIFLPFFFLAGGLFYALLSGFSSRWASKELTVRLVGWGPGRLIGMFVGGVLGSHFGGVGGAVIGAVTFFFVGRWLGSHISLRLGDFLERYFTVQGPEAPPQISPKINRLAHVYFFGLPLLLALIVLLFRLQNIDFNATLGSLPTVQLAFLAYSLLVVALIPIAARALRKGLISNQRVALRDPEYLVFLF